MSKVFGSILLIYVLFWGSKSTAQQHAQNRANQQGGIIKGIVKDAAVGTSVEYSTVSIFKKADSSLVGGTITDANGIFEISKLHSSQYYLEISFIGYHKKTISNIVIGGGERVVDLKTILLEQAAEQIGEVTVRSDRPPMKYEIDKKVIPVSQYHTAASGTAVDILENVPSISVDIEGNVSLRGSTSFTVLIDSKPTVLDANEALEQIPSSVIENIEIITNPSAKYDPEGTAGIINIITKKGKLKGTSGLMNLNVGSNDRYGGDMLWNYRKKKVNVYAGLDYNNRVFDGKRKVENRTEVNNITNYLISEGSMQRKRKSYGMRGGVDFQLDSATLITLGFRYGNRDMTNSTNLNYEEWITNGIHEFYKSIESSERKREFVSTNFDFQHDFNNRGHKLLGQINYSNSEGEEKSTNKLLDNGGQVNSGQISTEDGPSVRMRIKVDYTLPLKEKEKFEAGYQAEFRSSEDVTELFEYNPDNEEYILQPQFSHDVDYNREVHSLYTIYANEKGKFGYQLGMRGEYTNRKIELNKENSDFTINRWDYFPTVHVSYKFLEENQFMTSYTRRIKRPRGWYLEPFITWSDAFNVRQGNPDLKPEYIDSYEFGYTKNFNKHFISLEGYYRVTHNKIERVRSVYEENVMLHTMENVGTDYSLGSELMISLQLFKWWKNDLVVNIYNYKEKGELFGEDFSQESFNWSLRNNNIFRIDDKTRVQFTVFYNSKRKWAQGERKASYMSNASVKRDFFNNKLSATLQARGLFGSHKHEIIYEGVGFYSNSLFELKTPIIMLNLSFKINNYKKDRKKLNNNGNGEEEGFED